MCRRAAVRGGCSRRASASGGVAARRLQACGGAAARRRQGCCSKQRFATAAAGMQKQEEALRNMGG